MQLSHTFHALGRPTKPLSGGIFSTSLDPREHQLCSLFPGQTTMEEVSPKLAGVEPKSCSWSPRETIRHEMQRAFHLASANNSK